MKRMRALIVGVDGLIGNALARDLRQRGWAVTGTSRRPSGDAAEGTVRLDLAQLSGPDTTGLATLPDCDTLFTCAAMTKFAECRASPDLARRVNAEAPAALAAHFVPRGARVRPPFEHRSAPR